MGEKDRGQIIVKYVLMVTGVFLLGAVLVGAAVTSNGEVAHVYGVDEVAAGLRQHPSAWVGRTVLIWGQDIRFSWACGGWVPLGGSTTGTPHGAATISCRTGGIERLVAVRPLAANTGGTPGIGYGGYRGYGGRFWLRRGLMVVRPSGGHILALSPPDGLAAQLAQLPIVGKIIPATLLGHGAVYRVRLLDRAHCTSFRCPQGELL